MHTNWNVSLRKIWCYPGEHYAAELNDMLSQLATTRPPTPMVTCNLCIMFTLSFNVICCQDGITISSYCVIDIIDTSPSFPPSLELVVYSVVCVARFYTWLTIFIFCHIHSQSESKSDPNVSVVNEYWFNFVSSDVNDIFDHRIRISVIHTRPDPACKLSSKHTCIGSTWTSGQVNHHGPKTIHNTTQWMYHYEL